LSHHLERQAFRAVFAALALVGCSDGAGGPVESTAPPLVEAVQARVGALPLEETVPGIVRARNQVAVRAEIEARVAAVLVESGAAVERGQPLVRLEDDEPRERLRQAEANVRLVEAAAAAAEARVAELEARAGRSRALAAEELISAQELEILEAQLDALRASAVEAQARVEQARATAEERRSALAKTVVRSPVAGRVGERQVEVGMLVDPSTVLFVAGDLDELTVEVTLAEEMLGRLEEGLPVVIEPRGAAGEPLAAELSRISPFLAQESFTTVGEIDLDNRGGSLRPGMFVNVRLRVGESDRAVLVPVAAIWRHPASGERGVFVIEEAAGLETPAGDEPADQAGDPSHPARAVAFRRVEVVAEGAGAAGVEGIDAGAWVVTVGQHLLASAPDGEEGTATGADGGPPRAARVRPVSWERVLALQALQDEDLLEDFLAKQRTLAATLGAEIPASEDVVDRVLERAAGEPAGPGGR
jgi:RND family efflux transporter MFP subunit